MLVLWYHNSSECVGHVQKRLGTALRNYKKNVKMAGLKMSDRGKVDGRGRLTDIFVDSGKNIMEEPYVRMQVTYTK